MTKSFCHFDTIPSHMMDIIEEDLTTNFDSEMRVSRLMGDNIALDKRNSKNAWIPTTHWLGGLMWHYYKRVNDEIFHMDLDQIDGETMQYTQYGLNERYDWHIDEGLASFYKPQASGKRNDQVNVQDFINSSSQRIRKLSCIVQLSDPDDYEGGITQILDVDQSLYTIPKEKGTVVFFDSRLHHRAKMVTKGLRKSLITWAVGPRWK
tara:strand:- start:358 stop:978 length:621 start_codon:yes stop_codon:yes gene_type:complete